jgi:adenine-specific DNA-methyltransferase
MQSKENLPQRPSTKAEHGVETNRSNANKLLILPIQKGRNTISKAFKKELLYLLGLRENNEVEQCNGGKNLVCRLPAGKRQPGSLLELALAQLETNDNFYALPASEGLGKTLPERQYHVALQLCISWIRRILFLKLLEARLFNQLAKQDDSSILITDKIPDFKTLNNLFLQLTSITPAERSNNINYLFSQLPNLNTTLFRATALEQQTIYISELASNIRLPLFAHTVIDVEQVSQDNKRLTTLSYLLNFLNAFDFDFDNRGNSKAQKEADGIPEDITPSSPVCYMNSPELREEFIIPEPQPLHSLDDLNHNLNFLLISCLGAEVISMVNTD